VPRLREIPGATDESKDPDSFVRHRIDQAVVADEDLADGRYAQLRYHATSFRHGPKGTACCADLLSEG